MASLTEAVRVGSGVGDPVEGSPWAIRIGYLGGPTPATLASETFESEWDPDVLSNLVVEDFESEWDPPEPLAFETFESPWEELATEDFETPWE